MNALDVFEISILSTESVSNQNFTSTPSPLGCISMLNSSA